jgi:hypothetical protein
MTKMEETVAGTRACGLLVASGRAAEADSPSKETCTFFLARCDREEEGAGMVEEGSTLEGGLLPGMRFMVETAAQPALPLSVKSPA